MKLKQIIVILFVALMLGALVSFKSVSPVKAKVSILNPRVIYVGPTGNFTTIQAAINSATAGDIILVSNGTYKEHITVNKPLSLIGENRSNTIIDASGASYVVQITSSNVTLSGFTIQNTTKDFSGWGGIWLNGASALVSNVTIANCTVTDSLYAVWFNEATNNTFRLNDFVNNMYDFGFLSGASPKNFIQNIDTSNKVNGKPVYWLIKKHNLVVHSDAGMVAAINCTNIIVKNLILGHNGNNVLFVNTNASIIQNVTASNSDFGINLLYSYNDTVCNNTVSNNAHYGIILTLSNNNTIYNNNVSCCSWNLKLVTSTENGILSNTLINSTDIDGDGFMLDRGSLYNLVLDNIIRFNQRAGIALDDQSNWNVFTHNLIESNQGSTGGLELCDGSSNNLITENTFNRNSYGITSTSSDKPGMPVNNTIYKNNFLNNTVQVSNRAVPYNLHSTWDNGAEGNYWSNFTGIDANLDGISDTVYNIDLNNVDHYPLMEPWSRNRTYTIVAGDKTFYVNIVSNSTIGGFNFNQTLKYIAFNVTGPVGAKGFCNITIPQLLLNVTAYPGEWVITIDGKQIPPVGGENVGANATYTFFYLTYNLTTHQIGIKGTNAYPEFPVQAIFFLVVFFASLSVAVLRRKVH